jgi:hypothetical protein
MAFDFIDGTVSLLCLLPLLAIFYLSARSSPMAAVSLPCMTMLTSIVYFYMLPVIVLAKGDMGYFGMYISSLVWTHVAIMLYALGAGWAFLVHRQRLASHPAEPRPWDSNTYNPVYWVLWGLATIGVAAQVAMGKLNLAGQANYDFAAERVGELAFMTQAYNMMVPLTIMFAIRDKFKRWTWLVLPVVLLIFLQAGFRFRIMLLLAGLGTAFALTRRFRITTPIALGGLAVALLLSNVIGAVRRYGQGIDLTALTDDKIEDMTSSVGGEFGVVYVLNYTVEHPLPDPVMLEPWLVAIARLVPSFLWPDKPTPEYARHFIAGASAQGVETAGVAATQHVEMLLQFGWFGLLPLAFLYFSITGLLIGALLKQRYEARIAGCALVPAFFGYYMQTRGYFFQIFADALFMFGPLLILNFGSHLQRRSGDSRLFSVVRRALPASRRKTQ